jgi:glycosyltransferase involved in cell wall biosynthesis
LFDVADPDRHHVILISDLDRQNDYQRSVLERIEGSTWRRHVSVTGFLPAPEVAKLLAVSDAVVFPFPRGIGAWNTSVLAAMESGVFVLGTALDSAKVGYDAQQNLLLTLCGDVVGMREGLDKYLGRRRAVSNTGNSWASLASAHEVLYAGLV